MNRHPGPFSHAQPHALPRTVARIALVSILLACAIAPSQLHAQAAGGGATGGAAAGGAGAAPAWDTLKASTSPNEAQIRAGLKTEIAALTSEEHTVCQEARQRIIDAVGPDRAKPTPAFMGAFARALDAEIAAALQHPSERVRLNAAIAVANVAERTQDPALSGAIIALLKDKSRFVVLWGVKAVRSVLPAILRNPAAKPQPLLDALVAAVAAHGTGPIGGAITAEAYDALTIGQFGTDAKGRPTPAAVQKVLPYVHQLLQLRVEAYQKGIPPEPYADQRGTLFLVQAVPWEAHTPQQKVASVQLMSNLIGLAAQHVEQAQANERANLNLGIRYVASAIAVVPEAQPIQDQLKPLTQINEQTPAQQVRDAVNAVHPALLKVKAFAGVAPPPAAGALGQVIDTGEGAATQPTTGPATRPATTVPAAAPTTAAAPPPRP